MGPFSDAVPTRDPAIDVDSDVLILVMGPTGAGKSSFINIASNSGLRVSDSLESCTSRVQLSDPFTVDGRTVFLVDTPGLNDTYKNDFELLDLFSEFLTKTYTRMPKQLLHGVLYLHPISANRVSGAAMRSLHFYQALCGPEGLSHSVVVTTMWDLISESVGTARERQLKDRKSYFKPALEHGANCLRFEATQQCAHDIIRHLLKNRPTPLSIQRELIDQKKVLCQTAASQVLAHDFELLPNLPHELDEDPKVQAHPAAVPTKDTRKRFQLFPSRASTPSSSPPTTTQEKHSHKGPAFQGTYGIHTPATENTNTLESRSSHSLHDMASKFRSGGKGSRTRSASHPLQNSRSDDTSSDIYTPIHGQENDVDIESASKSDYTATPTKLVVSENARRPVRRRSRMRGAGKRIRGKITRALRLGSPTGVHEASRDKSVKKVERSLRSITHRIGHLRLSNHRNADRRGTAAQESQTVPENDPNDLHKSD